MIKAVIMSPFGELDKKSVCGGLGRLVDNLKEYTDGDFLDDKYVFYSCDNVIPEEALKEAEVIIGQPTLDIIKRAPKLRWVQGAFAGVDNLLKQGEFPAGVMLTNVTGAFGHSIAEHMIGMILMMYKKLDRYLYAKADKAWDDLGQENTLLGKNVLVLGAGDIGVTFARMTSAFGATNIGVRRTHSEEMLWFTKVYSMEGLLESNDKSLEELIAWADVVAMSLPSTPETRGLMNYNRLSAMKDNAMLVNVGRGDTLVTEDLVRVLKEKPNMSACLDVVYPEPLPQDNPLWDMKNVMITPHVSGGSFGHLQVTADKINDISRQNLIRYADGDRLNNLIDIKAGYVVR